jgi:predicted ATPase
LEYTADMKIVSISLENWKSFAATGEIALDSINVFVGRNNSGKSAILRAIQIMQEGADPTAAEIRLGTNGPARITVKLASENFAVDAQKYFSQTIGGPRIDEPVALEITLSSGNAFEMATRTNDNSYGARRIPADDQHNFIYTYLSKRKVNAFEEAINSRRTSAVEPDLRNLNAKVDRLASSNYEGFEEYSLLCARVFGQDFKIGTFASANGHQSGISVGRFGNIPLELMGEGVSSQLGLITSLCMADGHLFLVEEPENDIHPESLKALLEIIIEKSANNQFIVTTHSNIVTRYLGAASHSKVFAVDATFSPNTVPTSTIREIGRAPEARIAVLRQLGYELSDLDLWDGWLILEESSAEFIIRSYLIPWFAPRLGRIRTVAAGGTSKVEPLFNDYNRLFLFAHLEPQYRGRAWVIVDGEPSGNDAIDRLKKAYKNSWPEEHFRTFSEADFEKYYPQRFQGDASEALGKTGQAKRDAKKELVKRVADWCDANTETAMAEFGESAREVVDLLKEIERSLFA